MLDDEAVKALAGEILDAALHQWIVDGEQDGVTNEVSIDADGECCCKYEGITKDGYGTIICYYKPRPVVENLIINCERCFDDMIFKSRLEDQEQEESIRFGDRQWVPEVREQHIGNMAFFATMFLLTHLRNSFARGLGQVFEDGLLVALAVTQSGIARDLKGEGASDVLINAEPMVKELLQRENLKRRQYLTRILSNTPFLRVFQTQGRPKKVTKQRLLDAIAARRSSGKPVVTKGLAYDMNVDESTIRKAAQRFQVEIREAE